MSGVVFFISIPTPQYEEVLRNRTKNKVSIQEVTSHNVQCEDGVIQSSQENLLEYESPKVAEEIAEDKGDNEDQNESTDSKVSMDKILLDVLANWKVSNYTRNTSSNEKYIQVIFPLEVGCRCEELLDCLKSSGIGKLYNSIVSVVNCSIFCQDDVCKGKGTPPEGISTQKNQQMKKSGWNQFVSSVRSRLAVAQVVENVKTNAMLTFDFVCLLIIATILCAIGLVENSNVYLLSSMLISPMMGPVMAGTFGTVIRDSRLQKMGVQNELIGLGIATFVGFCYGTVICLATDKYGETDWPTYEMISRGEIRSLWVGCLIALLSGAAVALGILSDNIASLVGVAISTSLMPPAVNAGLLWSLASACYTKGNETTYYTPLSYTHFYSKNRVLELTMLGAVSICLTFINIICIYVAGIFVFKIKEVAPMTIKDGMKRQFWKHDIKLARDYNKTFQKEEAMSIRHRLSDEVTDFDIHDPYKFFSHIHPDLFHHSLELTRGEANIQRVQHTWSPCNFPSCLSQQEQERLGCRRVTSGQRRSLNFGLTSREANKLPNLFSPGVNKDTLEEETQHGKSKSCGISIPSKTRTFIVTPCSSDPLKNV